MLIYKYEVPNELIYRYCKIITTLEKEYSAHIERARSEVHNEIFDYVGCNRACVTRDERRFSMALMNTVVDLTFKGDK